MKRKVIHVINGKSPHPKRFFEILRENKMHEILFLGTNSSTIKSFSTFANYRHFEGINYISSLIRLLVYRFTKGSKIKSRICFHGHSAGKIGLFCYLSGFQYSLTIYGSEIYKTRQKSYFKRIMISKVLEKAKRILVYSENMKNVLIQDFGFESKNIFVFNFGINDSVFMYEKYKTEVNNECDLSNQNDITFIINRRIHPYYNTLQIIESFIQLYQKKQNFKVIFIDGKFDPEYKLKVKERLISVPFQYIYIEEFLEEKELALFYSGADYSLSFPNSDEISASVLQSFSMGVKPIINSTNIAYNQFDANYFIYSSLDQLVHVLLKLDKPTEFEKIKISNYYQEKLSNVNPNDLDLFFNY